MAINVFVFSAERPHFLKLYFKTPNKEMQEWNIPITSSKGAVSYSQSTNYEAQPLCFSFITGSLAEWLGKDYSTLFVF